MSSQGGAPSPGWYINPEGKKQWWDGDKWGPLETTASKAASSPPSSEPAKKPGFMLGCLLPLLLLLAGVIAFQLIFNGPDAVDRRAERDAPVLAQIACERAVKEQLKAPSSAKFVNMESQGAGGSFAVTGQVDAENSFGAMIRTSFSCTVEVQGENARVTEILTD